MRTLSFRQKLWLPLIISLFALIGTNSFNAYQTRQIHIEERKNLLEAVTVQMTNLIKQYDDLAQKGVMPLAEAQKAAMNRIRLMRYGADGYFTILSPKNIMLMPPIKPDLNGKDQTNMQDAAGNFVFQGLTGAAKNPNGGFYEYLWPHVGGKESVAKTSYLVTYAPWEWIISTGAYMDDINNEFLSSLYKSAAVLALVITFLVGLVLKINGDLMKTLSGAKLAAESISNEAAQIAQGNAELATRTEQQAGNLEETAAAMEELTSTIRQNADNARQTNQLAISATSVTEQGGQVVGEVVSTMESISASSSKIADIISVIDGIAFQTNILALNAAVEAARAGEQGRGFVVVATEVRSLAHRSANAAKEIKELIADSAAKVDSGSRYVSQGVEQINEAVTQMDQVTQQNAAMVEEAAATAENLQEQTALLDSLLKSFWGGKEAVAKQRRAPVQVPVQALPKRQRPALLNAA
ncbi:MAG: methyl-accepting chemotaxis protein [Candidatus Protistobacter heckmanni]|nr:methyl-accepting chemotaxis protein [Candidatus Protistobacter heckmanni]